MSENECLKLREEPVVSLRNVEDETCSIDTASVQWVFLIRTQLSEQQGLQARLTISSLAGTDLIARIHHTLIASLGRERRIFSLEETLFK